MKKPKYYEAKDAYELAELLGLTPVDAAQWELRSELSNTLTQIVKKKGLTHAQVAKLAETSRTRVTALMNHNMQDISTDLMFRILGALGYTAKITIHKAA